MRQTRQSYDSQDTVHWMEDLARGVLWAQALVVGFLTLTLFLMLGVGLLRPPILGEAVLRGLLNPLGLW